MKVWKFIHKWLGVLMAPLMVMWFISGYFMIFSGFPKADSSSKLALLDELTVSDSVPTIDQLTSWYVQNRGEGAELTEISLEKSHDRLSLNLLGTNGRIVIDARSGVEVIEVRPDLAEVEQMTYRITHQSPQSIDTLTNLEQWIPFAGQRDEMPIYRVSVADGCGTSLYFSGKSGRLLQKTDKSNRLMAWFGAVPHWLYFWQIREHVDLWRKMFVVLGVVGCLMIVSGIVMGIYRTIQARTMRRKRWSPYRKRWFYWHHITGLIFGIVVLTWMFSGWMSLDKLPKWMTGPNPRKEFYALAGSQSIGSHETLDFQAVIRQYPKAKRITFANYMGQSFYHIEDGVNSDYVMMADGEMGKLNVSQENAIGHLKAEVSDVEVTDVRVLNEYTANYLPHPRGKRKPPLPAYEVKTAEGTTLYVSTSSPRVQVSNKATILNSWAYQKLHTFKFLWAYHHPMLWMAVMLILLTGGTIVSITGLVLGWHVLRRRIRKV